MGIVAALMGAFGFTARSKATDYGPTATADLAYAWLRGRGPAGLDVTPADLERGEAAIAWAAEVEPQDSDYRHNLRVVARCKGLLPRTEGIAASMIAAHDRALAKERERAESRSSVHVGEVGKREVFTLKILSLKELDGQYGRTVLYVCVDPAGNRLKTFSSAAEDLGKPGETVVVKGTVKGHGEYQGVKETMRLARAASLGDPGAP